MLCSISMMTVLVEHGLLKIDYLIVTLDNSVHRADQQSVQFTKESQCRDSKKSALSYSRKLQDKTIRRHLVPPTKARSWFPGVLSFVR